MKLNNKVIFVLLLCFANIGLEAQIMGSNSRHLQTQYFDNPAYTGTSNTLAVNLFARKQWVGLDGAPTSYHIAAHAPVNNTMTSIGAGMNYEQFGVNKFYNASVSYAYLLKISPVLFLSLGINTNFSNYQVGFNQLNLIHNNDPYFSSQTETGSDFNVGTGALLYSRDFYLGLSVSHLLGNNSAKGNPELNQMLARKYYYGVTGYLFRASSNISIKPSIMYKYDAAEFNELSYALQFMYKDMFWMGVVYNQSGWLANVINIRIRKDLELAYAFENAVGTNSIKRNNHEISLVFSIKSFVKENIRREFGERRGKKEKEGIKSIRYF